MEPAVYSLFVLVVINHFEMDNDVTMKERSNGIENVHFDE